MNEIGEGGPSEEDKNFVAPETGEGSEDTTEELDFLESDEMRALTNQLVEVLKNDPENASELTVEWKHRTDEYASQLQGREYDKAMIDTLIAQANIWKEVGNMEDYYEDLEQAREYADNMGFVDVVESIDKLLA